MGKFHIRIAIGFAYSKRSGHQRYPPDILAFLKKIEINKDNNIILCLAMSDPQDGLASGKHGKSAFFIQDC